MKSNTINQIVKELAAQGVIAKPGTDKRSMFVELPGKRRKGGYSSGKGDMLYPETVGLLWPSVEQWEILGNPPMTSGAKRQTAKLRGIIQSCVPLWVEREKITFSQLAANPAKLPEFYRSVPKIPSN